MKGFEATIKIGLRASSEKSAYRAVKRFLAGEKLHGAGTPRITLGPAIVIDEAEKAIDQMMADVTEHIR